MRIPLVIIIVTNGGSAASHEPLGGSAMFHKKVQKESYDRENQKPIIRASICTGERVAGFKDIHTGKFTEVMLIADNKDVDLFLEQYDISIAEITKEW